MGMHAVREVMVGRGEEPGHHRVVAYPRSLALCGRARGASGSRKVTKTQRGGDSCVLCRGYWVGVRWLFEVSRSLQFGVRVVVTRGVVGFAVVV